MRGLRLLPLQLTLPEETLHCTSHQNQVTISSINDVSPEAKDQFIPDNLTKVKLELELAFCKFIATLCTATTHGANRNPKNAQVSMSPLPL